MLKLVYKRLQLDLKYDWTLSRNTTRLKENFIIQLHQDGEWGAGEAAPNTRYAGTADNFDTLLQSWSAMHNGDVNTFLQKLSENELPHALRCGMEQAACMLSAKLSGKSLQTWLGLEETLLPLSVPYTIPIMAAEDVEEFYVKQNLARFQYIKLKVGKDGSEALVTALGRIHTGPVIVDGNEAYQGQKVLQTHLDTWSKHILLAAVEQPFPAGQDALMAGLKGHYPFPFFADESLERDTDITFLAQYYDGINVKLQKAGGPIRAVEQIAQAKTYGLNVMVGCMVETSIGIWHSIQLAAKVDCADLDSMLYLQQEPFGWVTEKDGVLKINDVQQLPIV